MKDSPQCKWHPKTIFGWCFPLTNGISISIWFSKRLKRIKRYGHLWAYCLQGLYVPGCLALGFLNHQQYVSMQPHNPLVLFLFSASLIGIQKPSDNSICFFFKLKSSWASPTRFVPQYSPNLYEFTPLQSCCYRHGWSPGPPPTHIPLPEIRVPALLRETNG